MDLDRYVPRQSAVHRADPRLKIVLAGAAVLGIALLPAGAFVAFAIVWLVLTAASAIARLGALRLARGSWVVLPFALVALPLLFTRPGEVLITFDIGPLGLTITDEGVRDVLTIMLKSWLSVQVALLLAYTTHFPSLLEALRSLRVPVLIVSIIGFMYRYLAVLGDEAARMNRARTARSASAEGRAAGGAGGRSGVRPGGSITWRARVTGAMVGSLFIRSYEHSERVYAAMLARGFEGTVEGSDLPRPDTRSLVALSLALATIAAFTLAANLWALR